MSFELALGIVIAVSLLGNRIFSLLAGLILRVPAQWLLPTLYTVDIVQIPMFYWIYEHGSALLNRFPGRMRYWFSGDRRHGALNRWTSSLGGLGVFVVASMPTFGGGMWSAVFLAYGLRLRKPASYLLMGLGSLLSYLTLYWVLDTIVRTVRYFA